MGQRGEGVKGWQQGTQEANVSDGGPSVDVASWVAARLGEARVSSI
jgi:hypothetical protein